MSSNSQIQKRKGEGWTSTGIWYIMTYVWCNWNLHFQKHSLQWECTPYARHGLDSNDQVSMPKNMQTYKTQICLYVHHMKSSEWTIPFQNNTSAHINVSFFTLQYQHYSLTKKNKESVLTNAKWPTRTMTCKSLNILCLLQVHWEPNNTEERHMRKK